MRRRSPFGAGLRVGLAGLVVAMPACLEPTQIELSLRSDVPYTAGRSVAISVGAPGATESAEPTTIADGAWGEDGQIGTLVVLPADERDEPVAVRAVMGLGRDPSTCSIADAKGCIFARRRLSFVPHEPLQLPIALYAACEGVPCDESSTCTALGTCVSSELDPEACKDGKICEPTGVGTVPGGDASADADANDPDLDRTSPSDASSDGGVRDADSPQDAGTDAALECPIDSLSIGGQDFFDWGSESITGTFDNSVEPALLRTTTAAQAVLFKRAITPSNSDCPLHFRVDVSTLTLAIGQTIRVMILDFDTLFTEVLIGRKSAAEYLVYLGGSSRYVLSTTGTGRIEAIVPLRAELGPPRLEVAGDVVVFDDVVLGDAASTGSLPFGIDSGVGTIALKQVGYFFGP